MFSDKYLKNWYHLPNRALGRGISSACLGGGFAQRMRCQDGGLPRQAGLQGKIIHVPWQLYNEDLTCPMNARISAFAHELSSMIDKVIK
jgi:hypothetical protein